MDDYDDIWFEAIDPQEANDGIGYAGPRRAQRGIGHAGLRQAQRGVGYAGPRRAQRGVGHAGPRQAQRGIGHAGLRQAQNEIGHAGPRQAQHGIGHAGPRQAQRGVGHAGPRQAQRGVGHAGPRQARRGVGHAGPRQAQHGSGRVDQGGRPLHSESRMGETGRHDSHARRVGFLSLKKIADSADTDIIQNINKQYDAVFALLGSPIDRPDVFVLVMRIAFKVRGSTFERLKVKFFLDLCNSQFIVYLRTYLMDLPYMSETDRRGNQMYWQRPDEFWEGLVAFCEYMMKTAPSVAKSKCRSLIEDTSKLCLEKLSDNYEYAPPDEVISKLNNLREAIKVVEEKIKMESKKNVLDQEDPPDNFRELSVLPTRDDLMVGRPFIRSNIIDGAYRDVEHYLDVQFRLLREDCFGPLRDGIRQYVQDPTKRRYDNIRIYQNVTFLRPYISNNKIGTVIQVDQKTTKNFRNIKWEYSQRLKFGSLLLLTNDNCRSFVSSTVLDRETHYLKMGQIPVEILDVNIGDEIYGGEAYTMIESEVYFEPYQHVLRALQDPQFANELPMKKYIVDVDIEPSPPKYLEHIENYVYKTENREMQMPDELVFQPNGDIWPSEEELRLNDSQLEAYRLALTHEFAVIQGPPGTGKTHIGIEIAKTLLWNVSNIRLNKRFKCVLFLVCYTNHALDQFLEALLPYTDSIARVGGQSKNEALEKYNLSFLKKQHRSHAFSDLRNEVHSTMSQLSSLQNVTGEAYNGVLKMQHLEDVLGANAPAELEECCEILSDRKKCVHLGYRDPIEMWLFQNTYFDYMELIDVRQIGYEFGVLDYDEDKGKKKNNKKEEESETSTWFCFSLEEACKRIYEYAYEYEKELDLRAKVNLQRKIARLRGEIRLFREMRAAYCSGQRRHVHNVDHSYRWMLYFRWVDDFRNRQNQKMIDIKIKASDLLKTFEEARIVLDCEVLASAQVIGMTTSGAARLRKMIQNIGPPIVIVEEAAEVLEQHIITSLTKDCQHLILIGDHKQLRPSAAYVQLARQYNLEVSLFERMILNAVHARRLRVQHRMRPAFARLIAPHIYPDLRDHPSVHHFPDVRGLTTNLFFFTHDHEELSEEDSTSKSNPKEADMVLLLANYIMQQGYDPSDVTILSAYAGQMFYMRQERINYPHLDRVKMTLVDNYQGEESKIILLSLVRSKKIGFLGTENRVCVALSRAREGFYIFGNMNLLKSESTLWTKIDEVLNEDKQVGTSLGLRCENHKNEITMISSAQDFEKVPEGGCLLQCESTLACGHRCALLCHSYDRNHENVKCDMKCDRKCENDHPCQLKCHQPCRCTVRLTKKFPCGHENEVFCHVDPQLAHCPVDVDVTLECGHQTKKQCWVGMEQVRCPVPCDHRLEPCGHQCDRKCHVNHDPLHEKYQCRKPCARAKKGCCETSEEVPDAHQCKKRCYEECDNCLVKVLKKRSKCAHRETVLCSKDVDEEPCKKKCTRMLPCGHYCKKKCHEECGDCREMVKKPIAECQHTVRIQCRETATRALCTAPCERALSCGHTCALACRDACDADRCAAPAAVAVRAPCGHDVRPPCNLARKWNKKGAVDEDDKYALLQFCTAPCGAALQCEHACVGDCSRCLQGRLHVPCGKPCERQAFCGHICKEPCSKNCPPCRVPCAVQCIHSKCTQTCGVPCSMCKEKCGRSCPHGQCTKLCGQACTRAPCTQRCERPLACGHACRGYCGEPCPDVCNICRPDDFPRDFLGDEFEDEAIFVLLEDCGHVLHSEDVENLMNGDQESIGLRKCPFCRTPIIKTQRYKDIINRTFIREINPVKTKIYGVKKEVNQLRHNLIKKIEDSWTNVFSTKAKVFYKDSITILYRKMTLAIKKDTYCDKLKLEMYGISADAIDMLVKYCQDYDEKKNDDKRGLDLVIEKQIKILSNFLVQNVDKMGGQQQEDYHNELKRLEAMINLSKMVDDPIYRSVRQSTNVVAAEMKAVSVIVNYNIFDHKAGMEALKALKVETKISYEPMERKMIVKAIGLPAGSWFKCPNGHYYCIGECGGAMQTATCPECKQTIGGSNHALLSTNRHAPEFDGSPYARFSEAANNMGNFNLRMID